MTDKIGILGPKGSFGEIAGKKYDANLIPIYFHDHKNIIRAVEKNQISQGIVAAENMISGTVMSVLDTLYDSNVMIAQEIMIPITLCLAKHPKTKHIKKILTHPVARDQAKHFLDTHYPKTRFIETSSTSSAFNIIQNEKIQDAASIGPSDTAKRYNLQIIHDSIHDYTNNSTRFLLIKKQDAPISKNCKTSIAIKDDSDYPGQLYHILEPFAKENISLTKIESRPTKESFGRYIFYIDFIGHRKEKNISKILTTIASSVTKLKIMGSYHIDRSDNIISNNNSNNQI